MLFIIEWASARVPPTPPFLAHSAALGAFGCDMPCRRENAARTKSGRLQRKTEERTARTEEGRTGSADFIFPCSWGGVIIPTDKRISRRGTYTTNQFIIPLVMVPIVNPYSTTWLHDFDEPKEKSLPAVLSRCGAFAPCRAAKREARPPRKESAGCAEPLRCQTAGLKPQETKSVPAVPLRTF